MPGISPPAEKDDRQIEKRLGKNYRTGETEKDVATKDNRGDVL